MRKFKSMHIQFEKCQKYLYVHGHVHMFIFKLQKQLEVPVNFGNTSLDKR